MRLAGGSPFTGDLSLGGAGVTVKGNNSFGISLASPLIGGLQILGPISALGDASTGLRVLQPMSGLIGVSGIVSATGAGAQAVDLEALAASLRVYSGVSSTAYSATARIHLEQDGYTERFGGDGVNLVVGPRSADAASITGSVLFGGKLGQTGAVRPTFEVGVRDVFSGDTGAVTGAFAAGGSSFALSSTPITGAGALAKLGLKYAGSYVDVEVAAKAQAFEHYQEGDLKVAVSTRF